MDLIAKKILKYCGSKPGYIDGQFYGDGVKLRNCISHNENILNLIDHPKILPLIVDAIGWNIQNRDSTFDYKFPISQETDPDKMSHGWHFDYEEEFEGTTLDGRMPLLDFKVGWYISDHTEFGHSTIILVPGSFKWDKLQRNTWETWLTLKIFLNYVFQQEVSCFGGLHYFMVSHKTFLIVFVKLYTSVIVLGGLDPVHISNRIHKFFLQAHPFVGN